MCISQQHLQVISLSATAIWRKNNHPHSPNPQRYIITTWVQGRNVMYPFFIALTLIHIYVILENKPIKEATGVKKGLTKLAFILDKIAVIFGVQRRKSLQRMEVNMSRKINEAEKSLNPDTLNLNEEQKQELYFLEHVLLPNIFYDMGLQFLNTLVLEGGEIFLDTLSSIHKENPSYCCSYSAADVKPYDR